MQMPWEILDAYFMHHHHHGRYTVVQNTAIKLKILKTFWFQVNKKVVEYKYKVTKMSSMKAMVKKC